MQFEAVNRWPQWKQLYDKALPLIDDGMTTFTYEELSDLAGLDVRSDAGRGQFYKFRRELLRVRQLWMENIPKHGYTVIAAKDQPNAAYKRIRQARRKVGMAAAINSYVQIEQLTPEQRCMQAATAAVLHELGKSFVSVGRKFSLVSKQIASNVPVELDKLIASIAGPKAS